MQISTTPFESALTCPRCGGDYLHCSKVSTYFRREEDGATRTIEVTADGDVIRGGPERNNPSPRRDAVVLQLWCEGCDQEPGQSPLRLNIVQHKGQTFLWLATSL